MKKLCIRAIVPVTISVTGFVVLCCIILYSSIKTDITERTVVNATNLADTIVKSTRYTMLRDDRENIKNIINNIHEQNGVEHVRIFNKKGLVMYSGDPREVNHFVDKKTEGCAVCHDHPTPKASLDAMQKSRRFVNEKKVEVLAITTPIYNDPTCATSSCHFHSPDQVVLGILDIGLSIEPLRSALASTRNKMIIFSLMVLLLTIGGVAALLRISIFLPIQKLTTFTEQVRNGNLDQPPPLIRGEVGPLAVNIRVMYNELREAKRKLQDLKKTS